MRSTDYRVPLGLALLAAGVLSLVQVMLGYPLGGGGIWALVFAAAGAAFLYTYFLNRSQWWALFPGFALLAVGVLIVLGELAPRAAGALGATLVLGAVGLSFLLVYLDNRQWWWALIPAGVMFSLAAMVAVDQLVVTHDGGAGILFLGLGLTFAALTRVSSQGGRMRWALIPAGVLLALGVLITAAATHLLGYAAALALIGVGGYMISRTVRLRK